MTEKPEQTKAEIRLERARERPVLLAVVMLLFALSCIFCPTGFLGDSSARRFLAAALVRFAFGGLAVFFMVWLGFARLLRFPVPRGKGAWAVLACGLVIALNNFPFVPLAQGTVWLSTGGTTAFLFVLQCLSVGVFEELFFRGLIFTLLLIVFPDTKKGQFLAILVSSLVFGLSHLANLFAGGAPLAVLAQVGYSSLIGGLTAVVMLYARSVWPAVIVHFLFDVGGLMVDSLGGGTIWTVPNMVQTAVVSVAVVTVLCLLFARGRKPDALLPQRNVENHHNEEPCNTPDNR